MTEPSYDVQPLRRTQSTGDLPPRELPRPARTRISMGYRTGNSNHHLDHAPLTASVAPEGSTVTPRPQRTFSIPIVPELPATHAHPAPAPIPSRPTSWYIRTRLFFGYGPGSSNTRKALVSFIWSLSYGFVQIATIIVILGLASHLKSPTSTNLKEISACGRPLVVWNCIWIIKVLLSILLSYWSWRRTCVPHDDAESTSHGGAASFRPAYHTPTRPPRRRYHEAISTEIPSASSRADRERNIAYSHLYARLSLLSSLLTLTWFLTAQILEYTSIDTCRLSAPHVWWLTFAILCTMYITVLEIILFGVLVFLVLPTILLLYNVILLCLGRHPLQNPHYIKPEVKKLPKSLVDRIPLVIYIPPPPDDLFPDAIPVPKPAHSYPPKPTSSAKILKKRFAFLKKVTQSKKKEDSKNDEKRSGEASNGGEKSNTWEDSWEQGEYPFVRLEGNRAACAICLMDFEEPKKVGGNTTSGKKDQDASKDDALSSDVATTSQQVPQPPVENIVEEERSNMPQLEDAGEGPQPLRLLACGHVFHQSCIDPWLTEVSGRCPICQRPVEIEEPKTKKSGRHP